MNNEALLDDIISPKRDFVPTTPPGIIEEFLTGSIYRDFLSEINLRIEDMRDFYETCPKDKYLETRGGLAAMRLIAGIFNDLLENSKTEQEEQESED